MVLLIPADIDKEVKEMENATSFIWSNSSAYRRPQQPVNIPTRTSLSGGLAGQSRRAQDI